MVLALPGRLARLLICFSFACIATAALPVRAAGPEPLSLAETIRLADGQSRQLAAQSAPFQRRARCRSRRVNYRIRSCVSA